MRLFFQDSLGDGLCTWFHRELRGTLGRAWFWSHIDLRFPTSIELGYVASVALSLLISETGLIIFEPPQEGAGPGFPGTCCRLTRWVGYSGSAGVKPLAGC